MCHTSPVGGTADQYCVLNKLINIQTVLTRLVILHFILFNIVRIILLIFLIYCIVSFLYVSVSTGYWCWINTLSTLFSMCLIHLNDATNDTKFSPQRVKRWWINPMVLSALLSRESVTRYLATTWTELWKKKNVIINRFFKHKDAHTVTWKYSWSNHWQRIDGIIPKRKECNCALNSRNAENQQRSHPLN